MLAEIGELDEAFALVKSGDPADQATAIGQILENYTDFDTARTVYNDAGGIKILIGAPARRLKSPEAARRDLPKIALFVKELTSTLARARTLSAVAHLQAKAGDFVGAIASAESIPDIRRKDFAGPSDGFYDAVRPATLAFVAGEQAAAGDEPSAALTFGRALAEARSVETPAEKVVAFIVIAQQQAGANRKAAALATVGEAPPNGTRPSRAETIPQPGDGRRVPGPRRRPRRCRPDRGVRPPLPDATNEQSPLGDRGLA